MAIRMSMPWIWSTLKRQTVGSNEYDNKRIDAAADVIEILYRALYEIGWQDGSASALSKDIAKRAIDRAHRVRDEWNR